MKKSVCLTVAIILMICLCACTQKDEVKIKNIECTKIIEMEKAVAKQYIGDKYLCPLQNAGLLGKSKWENVSEITPNSFILYYWTNEVNPNIQSFIDKYEKVDNCVFVPEKIVENYIQKVFDIDTETLRKADKFYSESKQAYKLSVAEIRKPVYNFIIKKYKVYDDKIVVECIFAPLHPKDSDKERRIVTIEFGDNNYKYVSCVKKQ
ncbi:MAG: hypothetical protein RR902_06510 [Oscillospiraceae bacterium]